MNSRERIIAAINHQPVDRVPIDFGGTRQSGISVWAYEKLLQRLGLHNGELPRVFDVYQMLADIGQDLAERFGSDCVPLNRPAVAFGIHNENWKPFAFPCGLRAEVPGGFNPEPDPVQTSAAGMDPERLKREFGGKIAFWGGSCDAQGSLAHGTPAEVAAETERNLAVLAPDSGLV